MAVSLILQAPLTSGNVTSHPNHHEIKMFPFNVIKDNDDIPTEQAARILICYKCNISGSGNAPARHAALRGTLAWANPSRHGSSWLLVLQPSTLHLTRGDSASHWAGAALLSLLLTPGFQLCLLPLPARSQAEESCGMSLPSFIRGLWRLFPPTLLVSRLGGKREESRGMICRTVSQS